MFVAPALLPVLASFKRMLRQTTKYQIPSTKYQMSFTNKADGMVHQFCFGVRKVAQLCHQPPCADRQLRILFPVCPWLHRCVSQTVTTAATFSRGSER